MITVLSPTASSIYYVGNGIVPVSWDLGSLSSTLTGVNIDYSLDSGLTWNNITSVTGTNTSFGLTSIVEDFAGDVYNEDNWVSTIDSLSSITGGQLNIRSGAQHPEYYLTNAFSLKVLSTTASNMDISSILWYSGVGSGTDGTALFIYQDVNNHAEIFADRTYNPSNILLSARINGYWVFNTVNGPGYGLNTGLAYNNVDRVYRLYFDRMSQTIDFLYKSSLTSLSWTTITSISANFVGALSAGIGSRKFNANSSYYGHVDSISAIYTPTGATIVNGVSATDWMPYVGTTSTNTALIRISDNADSSVSAVNSLFSVLIPTTAINILNSNVIFNRNTSNGKIYKKNIQILK